ncbi:hypothetical protein AVEN_69776-1 [Araneus ventricosus]|uniref:Proline dehydrogenase n=1 Tax=Araneus ventricosus TaxID=182803 RepID=A0A4Y2CVV4_ARAVE|nr:hypothetical protein AVEN_69776-1 [Araneus ventricosus]
MRGLERVGGETCLRLLLKRTLYAQFVGGETPDELRECMHKVTNAGMRCMLAATMEEDIGEKGCEAVYRENCRRILGAIDMSAGSCPSPMIQLKLSGLLPARLLLQIGDCYLAADCRQLVVEALAEGLVGKSVQVRKKSCTKK